MGSETGFYDAHEEPVRSVLLVLRDLILAQHADLSATWKYGMPFFCYKDRMFAYLWVQKKTGIPYIGIVEGHQIEHPLLLAEKRSRMKILPVNPQNDLPVVLITDILGQALKLYQ